MLRLGDVDALERQLRASVVALNKKRVEDITLVEAVDEASLWPGSFDDLAPMMPSADLDSLLARAPLLICAIAAEIGFRFEGVGTVFWAKFSDALGLPVTMAQRTSIGQAFDRLAAKYRISRPSESAFSAHFSIISWPSKRGKTPGIVTGRDSFEVVAVREAVIRFGHGCGSS